MAWYLRYLHLIRSELASAEPTSSECDPCRHVLQDALDLIMTARVTQDWRERIVKVIHLAHTTMSSAPSQAALYQWRRLHTDACIINAILLLGNPTPLEAVASLDTAIIISGATGKDRLHIIHSLIKDIQIRHAPSPLFTNWSNYPVKSVTDVDRLESAAHCILQLENYPSLLAFQKTYFKSPFVLRGYAKEWPAVQEHPWRSANYLRSIAGAGRIVPVEIGGDYRLGDWSQKIVRWDEFLSTLDFVDQPCPNNTEVMYLAQHNLFMQFPALWADIMIPDYVYADLNAPDYTPPANDERLVINIWVGPRGTLSPAHTVCDVRQCWSRPRPTFSTGSVLQYVWSVRASWGGLILTFPSAIGRE
ncbi:hypothetical protein AX15_003955 [Amanita polypyramis BW_CC]|nr:hypothetical protein AX15_003955 [Amanita polypyramis BW_CC]